MYRVPLLLLVLAAPLCAQPVLVSAKPAPKPCNPSADVVATYDIAMNGATTTTMPVRGNQTGRLTGVYLGAGTVQPTFNPNEPFKPGEIIESTATTGMTSTSGQNPIEPHVWRTRARTGAGNGNFNGSLNAFTAGLPSATCVQVGDIDGDGDIDAVLGVDGGQNHVYLNEGLGKLTGGTINFGTGSDTTRALALGDVDGDGDLDIAVGNYGQQSAVYLNNGTSFSARNFGLSGHMTASLEFGDIDGDGDLDIVVGNYGQQNAAYLNDGAGNFTAGTRNFGTGSDLTRAVALTDVESDGDLDVGVGNYGQQNVVYLNDGAGNFTAGTKNFGTGTDKTTSLSFGTCWIILPRQDVAVGNDGEQSYVYLNDGAGNFNVGAASLGSPAPTVGILLGDFDGNGSLDAACCNRDSQNFVFLNDGSAAFNMATQTFGTGTDRTAACAAGDLDGDGDLDLVVANQGVSECVSCLNGSTTPIITVTANGQGVKFYDNVYINYNTPVAGLFSISVTDPNNFATSLTCTISYMTTEGLLESEFGSASAAVPYTLAPTTGVFNARGVNLLVEFTATNVTGSTYLSFFIVVNRGATPVIAVTSNGFPVAAGGKLYVPQNSSLASLGLAITVTDGDGDPCTLNATINNVTTQGFVLSEWNASSTAVPFTRTPTSGVFTVAGVTHLVSFSAPDGQGLTGAWSIRMVVVAGNAPPTILVTSNGTPVAENSTLVAAYGDSLASLGLAIRISDAENQNTSLAGTVGGVTTQGFLNSEFSKTSSAVAYTVTPTTGSFNNTAGSNHAVQLTADDGNGGTTVFNFTLTATVLSQYPTLEVREQGAAGAIVVHAAPAAGSRAFGNQDTSAGATAAATIFIKNAGSANLTLSAATLAGANASEFVLSAAALPATLTPGQSLTFTVAFDPSASGLKTARVSFSHNDVGSASPFIIEFSGNGTSPAAVAITSTSPLAATQQNAVYAFNFQATGGVAPYSWSVVAGSPPPGLTLLSNGSLGGSVLAPVGTYTFTVQVSDNLGGTDARQFSITVAPVLNSSGGGDGGGCTSGTDARLPLVALTVLVLLLYAVRRKVARHA